LFGVFGFAAAAENVAQSKHPASADRNILSLAIPLQGDDEGDEEEEEEITRLPWRGQCGRAAAARALCACCACIWP
jgi:hypothetical protein